MPVAEANGPIKHAVFDENTQATHEAVEGVAGLKIRVLALHLHAAGDVDVTFAYGSGEGVVSLPGADITVAQDPYLALPWNPAGWFELPAGEGLDIVLDGAVQVQGYIVYQLVR